MVSRTKLLRTISIKNIIMDYKKIFQLDEKAGQIKKWEQTSEYFSYKSEKAWYEKVTSKRNGEFYQAEELIE